MSADASLAAPGDYPDPRLGPWQGFSLAAAAAVQHLDELVDLDLWVVTAVEGDVQSIVASAGAWSAVAPVGTALPWESSFCLRMVARQGPTVAPDVAAVPAYADLATGALAEVRAYVGVPLQGEDGALYGTLCGFAGSPQTAELAGCLGSVQLLARLLSTVLAGEQIAGARSLEAARACALVERDALTGLHDGRGWQSALAHEDLRNQRYGGPSSVLALDLGGADDERTVLCGEVLRRTCRPGDVLARPGATELAVLALQCDPVAVRALHRRVRVALRTAGLEAATGAATRRAGERLPTAWARAREDAGRDRRRRGLVAGSVGPDAASRLR